MDVAHFTLIGLNGEGKSLAVDVLPCPSIEIAFANARTFLVQHPSTQTVEVYRESEFLGVMKRGAGSAAG